MTGASVISSSSPLSSSPLQEKDFESEQPKTAELKKTAVKTDTSISPSLFHQVKAGTVEGSKRFAIGCAVGLGLYCHTDVFFAIFPNFLLDKVAPAAAATNISYGEAISRVKFVIVIAPILEELHYRGVLQSFLLHRLPRRILKLVNPQSSGKWFDTKLAKTLRIVYSAYKFGIIHLANNHPYARKQAFCAAMTGVGLGLLAESRPGLIGSIGAHMTHNAVPYLLLIAKVAFKVIVKGEFQKN